MIKAAFWDGNKPRSNRGKQRSRTQGCCREGRYLKLFEFLKIRSSFYFTPFFVIFVCVYFCNVMKQWFVRSKYEKNLLKWFVYN